MEVTYIFGYGSLVDRASLEATLGRAMDPGDGPHPVRLNGFRRRWNVAAHSSVRPDYSFVDGNGAPWEGWFAFLGIEASARDLTLGAVYRLAAADLTLLDARERSYDRIEVTGRLAGTGRLGGWTPGNTDDRVFTYLPTAHAKARARHVGAGGRVMARYLRLVDRAYRALGDDLYTEHLQTLPPPTPFVVEEITVSPVDQGTRNEAIDPDRSVGS